LSLIIRSRHLRFGMEFFNQTTSTNYNTDAVV
jgi:hypothetical protein